MTQDEILSKRYGFDFLARYGKKYLVKVRKREVNALQIFQDACEKGIYTEQTLNMFIDEVGSCFKNFIVNEIGHVDGIGDTKESVLKFVENLKKSESFDPHFGWYNLMIYGLENMKNGYDIFTSDIKKYSFMKDYFKNDIYIYTVDIRWLVRTLYVISINDSIPTYIKEDYIVAYEWGESFDAEVDPDDLRNLEGGVFSYASTHSRLFISDQSDMDELSELIKLNNKDDFPIDDDNFVILEVHY